MRSDTFILLATQKNASDDDPATEAIYEIGTLASVLQLLKLPDGTVKVLLEGAQRAKMVRYTDCSKYYEADHLEPAYGAFTRSQALDEQGGLIVTNRSRSEPGAFARKV